MSGVRWRRVFAMLIAPAVLAVAEPAPSPTPGPSPAATPSPAILALEGIKAFEAGDLDAGRRKFEALLAQEPENMIGLVNLGSLEYRAGRLEEAEKTLRKATRIDPDSFPAWLTLGVVAYEAGRDDLALASLAQALLIEPSNPKARVALGVTLGRKGWYTGAAMELQQALKLDDTLVDAHFNLAVIYLQQTPPAPELARHHYESALKLGAERDSVVEKQLSRSKEKTDRAESPAQSP